MANNSSLKPSARDEGTILAVDVGGTAIKFGVWRQGELIAQPAVPTPKDLEHFVSLMGKQKAAVESLYGPIAGVAFSLPGAVNQTTGVVGGVSAVPYIHGFHFVSFMAEKLACPISMENDANCAALAELTAGGAKDVNQAVVLVIGSGIGGAVIVGKQIVKGPHLFSGEFGYMQLNAQHTFSQAASPVHHARRYSSEKGLTDEISGEQLFALAEAGDRLAEKSVSYLKDSLAMGIFNLMMVLDPECVLIGGAIAARDGFVSEIKERVRAYTVKNRASEVQTPISRCSFSKEANLVGAVFNYLVVHVEA